MKKERIVIPNSIMLGEVDNILREGKSVVIMTKGNSMLPFIRGERDSVELRRLPGYAPGDIVLSRIGTGHYVLHRIKAIGPDGVTLKGDGNLVGTEHCAPEDICGAAECIIRRNGRRVDCRKSSRVKRAERWNALPYTVRRYTLGLLRRWVALLNKIN